MQEPSKGCDFAKTGFPDIWSLFGLRKRVTGGLVMGPPVSFANDGLRQEAANGGKNMNRNLRRVVIAGNWKMNKTPREAAALMDELKTACAGKDACDIVVCVPFVDLVAVLGAAAGTKIHVGAQNVHFEKSGAYTGEVAAGMLAEMGVEYVIVGHSERRQYFGETDETVNRRAKAALSEGLNTIVCVGETDEQREAGITEEILSIQVKKALAGIPQDQLRNLVVAYEPVWAIGTGKTATAKQADEACGMIRKTVADLYDKTAADGLTIQYGGSMNAKNARELLACENVDGGLIGGASLKSEDFGIILQAANA